MSYNCQNTCWCKIYSDTYSEKSKLHEINCNKDNEWEEEEDKSEYFNLEESLEIIICNQKILTEILSIGFADICLKLNKLIK